MLEYAERRSAILRAASPSSLSTSARSKRKRRPDFTDYTRPKSAASIVGEERKLTRETTITFGRWFGGESVGYVILGIVPFLSLRFD